MMKVLAGDWNAGEYAAFRRTIFGKVKDLAMPVGMIRKEILPLNSIMSAETVTDADSLTRRAGWAAFGALILGPIGLAAGLIAGKKTIIAVEFKDGRKALMECGSEEAVALKAACF